MKDEQAKQAAPESNTPPPIPDAIPIQLPVRYNFRRENGFAAEQWNTRHEAAKTAPADGDVREAIEICERIYRDSALDADEETALGTLIDYTLAAASAGDEG
jgi:hypothetical protein